MKDHIFLKAKRTLKENEIEILRRTKENYTHEVIQDKIIVEITSWKTSEKKLGKYYFYNILTCGIVHIIAKYKPLFFIKLHCIPCIPKEADYFLIKDIYGEYKLCIKEYKRYNSIKPNINSVDDFNNQHIIGITTNNTNNLSNQITGFTYGSKFYEYNESMNKVIPIYFNLTNLTNRKIYQLFIEGLSTQNELNKFKERYGLNIFLLNYKLIILYFLKSELPLLLLSICLACSEAAFDNLIYFTLMIIFIIITSIYQIISIKKLALEKEPTLEGKNKKLKVKRKFMNEENTDYCYINNIDLLPGDLIYLQKEESVPCDGIILEGECIITLSDVNGSISEIRKKELDNNTNQFNYKQNKSSILYHGSKIIKSFSKLENNSILLLCINSGADTYKANQLINTLYLFKRNKKYSEIYTKFSGKKKTLFFHGLFAFILSSIAYEIIFFFKSNQQFKNLFNVDNLIIIIRLLTLSYLPSFHVISAGIIVLCTLFLSKENIKCFDKSRILYAGNVNTIFFDKTGTLTEKYLEINGFFPASIAPNSSEIFLKYYNINQIKELTPILIKYYSNYFQEEDNISNSNININDREKKINDIPKKMAVLFLECLVCCNDLQKINNKIYGNSIEIEIFSQLNWEMKIISENKNIFNNKHLFTNENDEIILNNNESIETDRTINNIYEHNETYSKYKIKILDEKLEIYPNNYYKISEGKKLFNNKNIINFYNDDANSSKDLIKTSTNSKLYENSEKGNKKYNQTNEIYEDIFQNDNNSYKLRVYKRFIKEGTLYSSAIVYNPIMKSLHFMTKGPPEKILPYCNNNFLPKEINKIIASYRKNGFINIILASKIINEYNYDKSLGEDYYMSDLIFCGIIVLKNKLKKDVKQVIQRLKNLNCDLILNTGDNIYNSLTISYESGLVSSKNIFVFDLNKFNKKITVSEFNEILKFEPMKVNNNIDKISSKNYKNKQSNIKGISSRKINIISNKFEKTNSYLGKEINNSHEELNSKKNLNNPYLTQKIIPKKIKEEIPRLNLENMNNNYYNNTNPINKKSKFRNFGKNDGNGLNFENQNPSINSKNELLEKSFENQIDNYSNNLNLIETSNNSNIGNNKNIASSTKNVKNINKSRVSAVFSSLNKNMLDENNIERLNSKKPSDTFPIKRKGTKNTSPLINNLYNIKTNNEYISSKLKNMRNDCIYCVSGRALRFIYENRFNPEYRNYEFPILLNHIKKLGKIFYEMKSKDKSFLLDYYRKIPDKIACMIGDGQNDIDAIMTSHVGISLSPPKNMNTILSHFHPTDGSLFCIEKIIIYGRVAYENIYLLGIASFLNLTIMIFYILNILYFNLEIKEMQLDFLSSNFFLLTNFSFLVKPDLSIKITPLFHNSSLFKKFFFCITFANLIINLSFGFIFINVFSKNKELEAKFENSIFQTYFYFFIYFQILGMIITVNSINFYRISYRNNYIYLAIIIVIYLILSFIFCIGEYSFHPFLYNILTFEYSSQNVDTFDDKNKFSCFLIFTSNIITYYLFTFIFLLIFNRMAKNAS